MERSWTSPVTMAPIHPLPMEPKYRTLIQAAVIAVLLGTVLHFHQPAPESEGATAQLSER